MFTSHGRSIFIKYRREEARVRSRAFISKVIVRRSLKAFDGTREYSAKVPCLSGIDLWAGPTIISRLYKLITLATNHQAFPLSTPTYVLPSSLSSFSLFFSLCELQRKLPGALWGTIY